MKVKLTTQLLMLAALCLLTFAGCLEGLTDWSYGEGYGDWDIPGGGGGGGGGHGDNDDDWELSKILRASAENEQRIVVVGNYILTSSDATSWKDVSPDTAIELNDVVWGGNQFVAVGTNGLSVISPDGENWTVTRGPVDRHFTSVFWDGSQYLAISYWGNREGKDILSSPDGINWSIRNRSVGSFSTGKIVRFGDLYVSNTNGRGCHFSYGDVYGSVIQTSTDGLDWTSQLVDPCILYFSNLISAGDRLIAVNRSGLYESNDALQWQQIYSGTPIYEAEGYNLIAWSGERFISFLKMGRMTTSTDGVEWVPTEQYANSTGLHDLRWTGKRFVAAGSRVIMTSEDGLQWSTVQF